MLDQPTGKRLDFELSDRLSHEEGWVYMTGMQALVRLPLQQRRRDMAAGLNTGGYISGYRGSPLGRYDMELWQAEAELNAHGIVFQPGLNEDLAATAAWGSQMAGLFPGAEVEGVFSIWYGKTPGMDRAMDALRHANLAGTNPKGGSLLLVGDDHGAKSSSVACYSDLNFMSVGIPLLAPANAQEVLDFGLQGIALSRFSGRRSGPRRRAAAAADPAGGRRLLGGAGGGHRRCRRGDGRPDAGGGGPCRWLVQLQPRHYRAVAEIRRRAVAYQDGPDPGRHGCDLVVAGGESLSKLNLDRALAITDITVVPTSDFARNPDWALNGDEQLSRLTRLLGARARGLDAQGLATRLLGDALYANMLLVGASWQSGALPLSLQALDRAIALNGGKIAENRRAFDLGRLAIADPQAVAAMLRGADAPVVPARPGAKTLDEVIAHRATERTAYKDAALARRYTDMVARTRAAATRPRPN